MKILNNLTPDFTSGFTYNYLKSPEDFSNTTYWGLYGVTITTNSVADPIYGTLTADTLNGSSLYSPVSQSIANTPTVLGTKNVVLSFYMKKNTSDNVMFEAQYNNTGQAGTYYTSYLDVNLTNGTVQGFATVDCVSNVCTNIETGNRGANIQSIGNGWYRISLFQIAKDYGANTQFFTSIYPNPNSTNQGIYIWGAQLETTTATTATQAFATLPSKYISTSVQENLAEFSYPYKFPTWNSGGVNLLKSPEDFSNTTYWLRENIASVTTNSVNDPIYGTLTADTITATTNSNGALTQSLTRAASTGTSNIVYSVYIKANTSTNTMLSINWTNNDGNLYNINLFVNLTNVTTGKTLTVCTPSCSSTTDSSIDGKIESVGNGWYRVSIFSPYKNYNFINLSLVADSTQTGSNKSIYVWGAQLETTTATTATQAFTSLPSPYLSPTGEGAKYSKALKALTNSTASTLKTTSLIGNFSGSSAKWSDGVLATNGKIYFVPYTSTQVLVLDPITDTTSLIPDVLSNPSWNGGVLAPNGNIYCIPRDATPRRVLKINTTTDRASLIGDDLTTATLWIGGVLAPNGFIYGIPFYSGSGNQTRILKINPTNDTTTVFTSTQTFINEAYVGGVLAPNGNIYFIPYLGTQVLVLNTATDTTTFLSTTLSGGAAGKWLGGVLGANGIIYGVPFNSTSILKIDTVSGAVTTFGAVDTTLGSTAVGNWGGKLAPDGLIYFARLNGSNILMLNTNTTANTESLSVLGASLTGSQPFQNVAMSKAGNLYFVPRFATSILKLNLGIASDIPDDFLFSRYRSSGA